MRDPLIRWMEKHPPNLTIVLPVIVILTAVAVLFRLS